MAIKFAREIAYSRYISEVNGDNREVYRLSLTRICRSLVPIVYQLTPKNE